MSKKRASEDVYVVPARTARPRTVPPRAVDPVRALVSMRDAAPAAVLPPPPAAEHKGPVREQVDLTDDLTDDDGVVIPDDEDGGGGEFQTEEDRERARAEASEGVPMGLHICGSCLQATPVDELESCRKCGLVFCPMCMPLKLSCAHAVGAIYCEFCASCAECEPNEQVRRRAVNTTKVVCITAKCSYRIDGYLFAERGWHPCYVCGFAVCSSCLRICKHAHPLCKECECATCLDGR